LCGNSSDVIKRRGLIRRHDVQTVLLDDMLADVSPWMIKLDVEGAELKALRGAREVLKRVKYVFHEVSRSLLTDAGDAGDTPEAVLAFWQGINYSCRPSKVSRTDLRTMFTGRDVVTDILCTNLNSLTHTLRP